MYLLVEDVSQLVPFALEVVLDLEVHPEAIAEPEVAGEPKCRVGRDRPLAMDDLVDTAWGHTDVLGQAVLADTHRLEEVLHEDLTGMDWFELLTHVPPQS